MAYIDLVVCKAKDINIPSLYQAPAFSRLQKDDRVIVENGAGELEVTVVASASINVEDKEKMDLVLSACNENLPLRKVLKRYYIEVLDYKED